MTGAPSFPPLLHGRAVPAGADPFAIAQGEAARGCDAGLVLHDLGRDRLSAALVLAPDVALRRAVAMLPACGVGFQNALGALAPPEVAVHLEWTGGIRINGACCGGLCIAAASHDPDIVPDWLVIGLTLPLWPESDDPGRNPDHTALYAEGCADVAAPDLLESWARHMLVWITRWEDGDAAALHSEWRSLAHDMGEDVAVLGQSGTFLGVDEDFGMLLRQGDATKLLPLTLLLEETT